MLAIIYLIQIILNKLKQIYIYILHYIIYFKCQINA